MKLDVNDLEIIRILQDNARIPLTEIAKRVPLNRATIKAKIERLQKWGIIKKFTVIVNREISPRSVLVFFTLKVKKVDEVVNSLSKKSNILELYTTLGGKNIICKAYAKNLDELKRLINEIEKIKEIEEEDSFLVLEKHKEEYEVKITPEIGILVECDICKKIISEDIISYKLHNKEYYFCCETCFKKFKEQRKRLRRK